MPRDIKNTTRMRILDGLFRTGAYYTKEDLLGLLKKELGSDVSPSTLDRDLGYLKTNAPLEETTKPVEFSDNRKNLRQFRYKDPKFSIFNTALTHKEAAYIESAIDTLGRFQFAGQEAWLSPVLELIRNKFCDSVKNDDNRGKIVSVDGNENYTGTAHLGMLYQSIIKNTVLEVRYKSIIQGRKRWKLHPYFLKQYNNRWFLFAWNEDLGKMSTLSLDRIAGIEIRNDCEYRPNVIDFEHYFDDIIGVTKVENELVQKVVLRFSAQRYKYIETKPIHKSQKKVEGCDNTIAIWVRWNRELDSTILYFGNQVEVLEPQSLRDHIKAKVAKMAIRYKIIKS